MTLGFKSLLSPSGKSLSNFYELENSILTDILLSKKDFVLIDMPEVMLRMKVASMYSLDQLKDIFNDILNKVSQAKEGDPRLPDVAAYYYYPEIFQKPRDEYMAAMLHEIANDT
jgi:hypothetical protein